MKRIKHSPRCAIFHDPPSLQDASACNCGAIPPLKTAERQHMTSAEFLTYLGTDAQKWAEECHKVLDRNRYLDTHDGDDLCDLLMGWFANAIGAGEQINVKPYGFHVEFVPEDWRRVLDTAKYRGYDQERDGHAIENFIRDCALGKYEATAPKETNVGELINEISLAKMRHRTMEREGQVYKWLRDHLPWYTRWAIMYPRALKLLSRAGLVKLPVFITYRKEYL